MRPAAVQGQIEGLDVAAAASARLPWPKALPERVVAARDLLAEHGELTTADLAARFKAIRGGEAEKILESLAVVGLAIANAGPGRAARRLRSLR